MTFTAPSVVNKNRQPNYPIHPLIYSRWSPRSMSGEVIKQDQLMSLFEAARWAPSASNLQPWTFLYARRESKDWPVYFELLNEFNQTWSRHAAVLVVVVAQVESDDTISHTAEFDTGAAWQNLALEATHQGLIAHGIGGFDRQQAVAELKIPTTHRVIAMIAIGIPGKLSQIPERMQKQEVPNQRKSLEEMVKEGTF